MKKLFCVLLSLLMVAGLFGCASSGQPETTPAETTVPEDTVLGTTAPPETISPTTEPAETVPPTTELSLAGSADILREVMENTRQLRAESGSVMYLSEYLAIHDTELDFCEYVDFDQDGEMEALIATTSPITSYLVLHWNGSEVCCFGYGHRSFSSVKVDGGIAGSNGASSTVYYRLSFVGNEAKAYTIADIDTWLMHFVIDGKEATQEQAEEFLRQWSSVPNIIGADYEPPEDTVKMEDCAYCGEAKKPESLDSDGLCGECREYVGKCHGCGKLSDDLFEGYCTECEPWGGRGEPEKCVVCGTESWDVYEGLCEECSGYYGYCHGCGKLSDDLFEGYCSECEPWGGMG